MHLSKMMFEKDLRDNQRFEAQQLALRDALISQEKAVNAALAAAQNAVTKAEIAAEKRFDAVNEFRGQLADQAANFMPRSEALVLINGIKEQVDRNYAQNVTTMNALSASDQLSTGRGLGSDAMRTLVLALLAAGATIFGIVQSLNH